MYSLLITARELQQLQQQGQPAPCWIAVLI